MTKDELVAAIAHIKDDEHRLPLTELGLIRDITTHKDYAAMTLLLTPDAASREEEYKEQITQAVKKTGITDVHIRFKAISNEEKNDIIAIKLNKSVRRAPTLMSSPLVAGDSGVTFIAVASGKGGVGKSTVTVNLAAALAKQGKRVGIIDADIYGYSIPNMLGIKELPQKQGNRIAPVESQGIKVISTGFFVQGNKPVVWRGPMLGKMLGTFLNEVEWGPLDYMILDLPPGTGDVALDVHNRIPNCAEILVTTPHGTAHHVAARAGEMAIQTNHPILGVIENMSYFTDPAGERHYLFGRGGGQKLAEQLNTKLLAEVPIQSMDVSGDDSSIPALFSENSVQWHIFTELAKNIIQTQKD
ncbi:Mrp/NBP35 family ATP-binding protein [Paenibacillus donghaensis]|uniref:Mrp/NBP35 family ATP-binding protein n=1 Tax=Paenibacillus donghaensis TaxID=414771 RepID=UPI0018839C54|nr:Mrp/NBP35 family ATP-binding protein [Paenibacillus donghaensis]MBE9913557.1 Mrp/NBP35 family ATP-binding protein [Paenibacillus donghaensis]